jgi:4-aminobutyrate aminotransferase
MELPKRPVIRVEPPGPRARKLLEEDAKYLMQSFVRWYPLVVSHARDYVVYDVDGNAYIDLNSGIGVLNVGSSNPEVIEAAKRQLDAFTHYSLTDFYYEVAVELARKLIELAPWKGGGKVFFTNSGTESVEAALKAARYSTRRPYIIAFLGAFHGRTLGSLSLTASKPTQRKGFAPLLPGVIHVPYPYSYRCPFRAETPEECGEAVIGYIEEWIFGKLVDPSEVAAFVLEPIQGEGGYIVPPDNFLPKLRSLADKHRIFLISDEVQSGFCRAGKWFAIENWGVEPDAMTLAKAIAGGLPLGALVGKDKVMTIEPGGHASTFGGNPVSAAAALAVIDYISRHNLCERARKLGEDVIKRFTEAMDEIPLIGDVRGKGLMIGVELVRNRKTKEPASKELGEILMTLFKRGYLVIGAGISTIRIAPPLTIDEEALNNAVDEIIMVLREFSARLNVQ